MAFKVLRKQKKSYSLDSYYLNVPQSISPLYNRKLVKAMLVLAGHSLYSLKSAIGSSWFHER